MKHFFSCDWGTSAFRLRLIDAARVTVLSEIETDHGIAKAFELWNQAGNKENRTEFYKAYLFEQLKKMPTSSNELFDDVPVILSGMASSGIGMMELPYKEIPFSCDGSNLVINRMPSDEKDLHKIILISGAKSETDVMRGEETMLVGCGVLKEKNEKIFIFPGTHSKHIIVKNGEAKSVHTYMTGELFDLLSNKSILSASVKKSTIGSDEHNRHFCEGVIKGSTSNLLNNIFEVRTNQLFNKATEEQNYQYLSGLLIGHELKDLNKSNSMAITLVCSGALKKAYSKALAVLSSDKNPDHIDADEALIKGQLKIISQHKNFI